MAPLKIASGCDRRCTFCAIPSFRGSFVSRPANEIMAEAKWLADQQVTEVVLVSENSTSYGKDLPGADHLETLLTGLARTPGLARVRLTYLQPAETRPSLIAAIATTAGVADYFDMSFQHASATVLRRMRRFGSRESFLALVDQIRAAAPDAGIRTNVIVGFPGETEDDLGELEAFLVGARLDAVGVFGYSDEDGTAAADLDGKLEPDVIADRVERITALAEEISASARRGPDRDGGDRPGGRDRRGRRLGSRRAPGSRGGRGDPAAGRRRGRVRVAGAGRSGRRSGDRSRCAGARGALAGSAPQVTSQPLAVVR